MIRRAITALMLLLAGTVATAQVPFPQTLPPNTVYGRLGISAGPGQAIPFSIFSASIQTTIQANLLGLTTKGDTNYTILTTDHYIVTSAAFTAARTWTLPASGTVSPGQQICTLDQFGGVSATNTLTVARSGSDTIGGATSLVLSSPFTGACFIADGVSKWTPGAFSAAQPAASNKAVYVSTAGNNSNDGLSWATAKLTIQAGLDLASTAGVVQVGAGTYTLTSAIAMRPGVHLLCMDGAIITQGNSQNLLSLVNFGTNSAHFGALENCTIDGNRAGNSDNLNVTAVNGSSANDIIIRNNIIKNSNGYGIDVAAGVRPQIQGNTVTNVYVAGIAHITNVASTAGRTRIENNRISQPIGQHAIMVVQSDYAIVRGNVIDAGLVQGSPSAAMNVSTSGTTVTWVSGPNFSTVSAGQFLVINGGLEFFITSVTDSTHLQVTPSPGTLGSTPATIGTGDLLVVDSSSYGIYANNTLFGGATQGIAVSTTTGGQAAQKNLVANNNISYTGEMCIGVAGITGTPVADTSVIGNMLNNCGQSKLSDGGGALSNSGIGIFNSGPGTVNTYIDGNYVRDDQGTPTDLFWLAVTGLSAGDVILGSNGYRGTTNNGVSGDVTSITLSAGWGSTAATSAITSQGNAVQFTITANGAGIAAQPSFTVNKLTTVSGNPPLIQCKFLSGTGAIQAFFGEQNSTAGAWVAFYNGTPVAGSTYIVNCK